MTNHEAKATLRAHGMNLRVVDGEYRVNFLNGDEDTAYYTDDREDAVNTGLEMVKHQEQRAAQAYQEAQNDW